MPVTQNYKTVTFSADALMYVRGAVVGQLNADKARIEVARDSGLVDFLRCEIATGTEVLNALNAASSK